MISCSSLVESSSLLALLLITGVVKEMRGGLSACGIDTKSPVPASRESGPGLLRPTIGGELVRAKSPMLCGGGLSHYLSYEALTESHRGRDFYSPTSDLL